jgi:hypothetical protein
MGETGVDPKDPAGQALGGYGVILVLSQLSNIDRGISDQNHYQRA